MIEPQTPQDSSPWSDTVDEVVVAGLVLGSLVAGCLPAFAVATYIGTVTG